MNINRFLGSAFAVFVFIFFFEYLLHGVMLMGDYTATASIWRDFSVLGTTMLLHVLVQFLFAIWITFVFTQIYPLGGLFNGLRYGIYFGVFAAFLTGMWYFYLPVSTKLGWSWFVGSLAEGIIIGVILGLTYKRYEMKQIV
jgi:hypothetical protein